MDRCGGVPLNVERSLAYVSVVSVSKTRRSVIQSVTLPFGTSSPIASGISAGFNIVADGTDVFVGEQRPVRWPAVRTRRHHRSRERREVSRRPRTLARSATRRLSFRPKQIGRVFAALRRSFVV